MKPIIIVLVACLGIATGYAQKSKLKANISRPVQENLVCCCCECNTCGGAGKYNGPDSDTLKLVQDQPPAQNKCCIAHQVNKYAAHCASCKSKVVVDRRGSKQPKTVYTCEACKKTTVKQPNL